MTKIEKNIITWLEEHVHICFFIAVLILGCVMRIAGFHFIGSDMELCLLDWYKDIMQKGISEQVGNYNIPYQVIILILTKLPLKPHHAYKLVSCAFDLAMAFAGGWIGWKICEDNKKTKALFAFSIVFLSPLVVINSAVWGQCDSIYTFFVLLALMFLYEDKKLISFIMLGSAFAFKLQAVFIVPFFIYCYVRRKKFSITYFLLIPIMMIFWSLPCIFA